jgi:hypothetical protein
MIGFSILCRVETQATGPFPAAGAFKAPHPKHTGTITGETPWI